MSEIFNKSHGLNKKDAGLEKKQNSKTVRRDMLLEIQQMRKMKFQDGIFL